LGGGGRGYPDRTSNLISLCNTFIKKKIEKKKTLIDMAPMIKMTLIGDERAGKSSIFRRIKDGDAHVFLARHKSTIGLDFATMKNIQVEGKEYSVMLWDTSGDVGEREMIMTSLRDTNVAIICVDLFAPKQDSDAIIRMYVSQIRQKSDDKAKILLVATKSDLRENKDQVAPPNDDLEAVASELGIEFCEEVSALNGKGIDLLWNRAVSFGAEKLEAANSAIAALYLPPPKKDPKQQQQPEKQQANQTPADPAPAAGAEEAPTLISTPPPPAIELAKKDQQPPRRSNWCC
jgi:small GTP-binding protein